MEEKTLVNESGNEQTSKNGFLKNSRFSGWQLGIFAAVFALVGFFLIKSFAAGVLVSSLEAEQMTLPAGSTIYSDSSASGGQAVQMTRNGALTGNINLPSQATSVTLVAKGSRCSGSPIASLAIDGAPVLASTTVGSSNWRSYTASLSLGAGSHSVTLNGSNLAKIKKGKRHACSRQLYVDKLNFFGQSAPTPPPASLPTASLSASPASVTAGQTSTLTWSSTNATGCTASGAWSGTKLTTGTENTASLNTTSTYTLVCTGSGGSATANATVTVNQSPTPTPTPTPPDVYLDPGTQSYGLGSTFTVTVKENSGTNQVNAVQANLSYPADKLTLVSVDSSTSAFTTQAQNTGANGSIQIARGIIGNLTGDQVVAVLTFKVNSVAGTASVAFTTGTDLISATTNQSILPSLSSAYGGNYTLQ